MSLQANEELKVRDLEKVYEERSVLDIPALSFHKGWRYALIGPNGSGKTTFLRCIIGTLESDSGTMERASADMGYLPQKPYIFSCSVARNVALGSHSADDAAIKRALRRVGMEDRAEEKGNTLSGGEAQRIAVARVLLAHHDLLLLDEPTASLDIEGTALIEEGLEEYCNETGCTLIMATHFPPQALRMTSQTILLDHGKLVEEGTTKQVLLSPSSEIGQRFLSYWKM